VSTDNATLTAPDGDVTGRSILLDAVTKRYPGQAEPAVDGITLEIPAGKIVMLVGPVRLRQDDHAEDDQPAHRAHRGPHRGR
jgi:ABC-type protease/lipase transport system fused ATPase/permease subunit